MIHNLLLLAGGAFIGWEARRLYIAYQLRKSSRQLEEHVRTTGDASQYKAVLKQVRARKR